MDAVKVNPQDGEAVKMVTRLDALFLVDRDARQKRMSGAERLAQTGAASADRSRQRYRRRSSLNTRRLS